MLDPVMSPDAGLILDIVVKLKSVSSKCHVGFQLPYRIEYCC